MQKVFPCINEQSTFDQSLHCRAHRTINLTVVEVFKNKYLITLTVLEYLNNI